jgi:hypothetical protein
MIGESHSEFVANSLKETYQDLEKELDMLENGEPRSVIWDYDAEMEKDEILRMLDALEIVYSWYSCDRIDETKD